MYIFYAWNVLFKSNKVTVNHRPDDIRARECNSGIFSTSEDDSSNVRICIINMCSSVYTCHEVMVAFVIGVIFVIFSYFGMLRM